MNALLRSLFFSFCGAILVALMFAGCTQPTPQRGHSPWVFRTSLDDQPRMLVAALSDSFWVAYQTEYAALSIVWRDGVNFDGPVYTTRHGRHPSTKGNFFLKNPPDSPWEIQEGGSAVFHKVYYTGHRFRNGKVELNYLIQTASGKSIRIKEIPEFVRHKDGYPGLQREFLVQDMPENHSIVLRTMLNSIPGRNYIKTNGELKIISPPSQQDSATYGLELLAMLRFRDKSPTLLTTWFLPGPVLPNPFDISEKGPDPGSGFALIDQTDCKTCHDQKQNLTGPSYEAIAQKYKSNARTLKTLAQRVISGGTGVWGKNVMVAHPDLSQENAEKMVEWILALDTEDRPANPVMATPGYNLADAVLQRATVLPDHGLAVNGHLLKGEQTLDPKIPSGEQPIVSAIVPGIHFPSINHLQPLSENFHLQFTGNINIPTTGTYHFRLYSDDGSRMKIDGKTGILYDGNHGFGPKDGVFTLEAGTHSLLIDYFQGAGGGGISLLWLKPETEDFEVVPTEAYSFNKNDLADVDFPKFLLPPAGDGAPLPGLHPSYDLMQARLESFQPRVGGIDFLSDGRMVVCTWEGFVYLLDNLNQPDPEKIQVKQIAEGLAEPMGLKVAEDKIYVLQKQELTLLVDHDGDEITDEYSTICNSWPVTTNFHEFAFGLEYWDGFFYATLSSPLGAVNVHYPERGSAVKINPANGKYEILANGFRTPNGVGMNAEGEMFVADNQGNWLPANKIVQVQKGAFYGYRDRNPEEMKDWKETAPMLWLQQTEIANSPSQIIFSQDGPYAGQMLYGDVTHGGIKRANLEKINGVYQGAVFRFTQGLEAGVNRLRYSPDGGIFAGGVGAAGNWGQEGKLRYGLQQIRYNGKTTFEMLAVNATPNGLTITFTEPLAPNSGNTSKEFQVSQWRYIPTKEYGGPKIDEKKLKITGSTLSPDRKSVQLQIEGMEAGHVLYIHLTPEMMGSSGQKLWSTEAWYTLNEIPAIHLP
ncbi:MAG: PA14 domain-containing protein [Bacteroidia bacterium]